jgi:hypothetical protein
MAPNADEITELKGYTGPREDLCKVQNFLLELTIIPSLMQRLECLLFKQQYDLESDQLQYNIKAIDDAVKGIRDSKKLKRFIAYVLKIGNYLNAGTNKGKSMSFGIDLLI